MHLCFAQVNFNMKTKNKKQLPSNLTIERAQTQKNANKIILTELINRIEKDRDIKVLDLPCGNLEFLSYVKTLFPKAELHGADIVKPNSDLDIAFYPMDLTKDFTALDNTQYDLVTSISGVMMFSNTLSFIENCSKHLKPGGTFIITNDNNATIIDRIAFLFLGRFRMFKAVFDDHETLTENVPIQELVRLLRKFDIEIERIEYTSLYLKDLIFLPATLIIYPFQMLHLRKIKSQLPDRLIRQKYPFKHFFYKNYIIYGHKKHK